MERFSRLKMFETVFLLVAVVSAALAIQAFAVKPFQIPSRSMEPTLSVDQRVLVDRLTANLGSDPEIGDVIVFHPPLPAVPEEPGASDLPECAAPVQRSGLRAACSEPVDERGDQYFIKRVVAGPGDRLTIDQGVPIVNGRRVEGDWETVPCEVGACNFPGPITIPDEHYFVMGDNRPGSSDSRFWGPVPRDWIIGTAFATYWPPRKVGGL